MKKIGLLGVNPICQIANQMIKEIYKDYEVFLFDDDPEKLYKKYMGYPVIGSINDVINKYKNGTIDSILICIGERSMVKRKVFFEKFKKQNISFPIIKHHSTILSDICEVNEGCILSPGVIIGHNTIINSNCFIAEGSTIAHDCMIGSHCYTGANIAMSGYVNVGECTMIGTGAVILPEIKIGYNCVIGAGAVVTQDVPDNKKVVGNPARIIS